MGLCSSSQQPVVPAPTPAAAAASAADAKPAPSNAGGARSPATVNAVGGGAAAAGAAATGTDASVDGGVSVAGVDLVSPWTDPDFPPEDSSLCADWATCPHAAKWRTLQWKRGSQLFSKDTGGTIAPAIFFEGIEPSDIQQGLLGDCYYLGALSALAEHPERVRRLFVTQEANAAGRYTVRFHKDGVARDVEVDDWFPVLPASEGGGAAFSRAKGPELWVLLLEKAWAKLHGSYFAIESGNAGDALQDLTGAPNTTHSLSSSKGSDGAASGVGSDGIDTEAVWAALLEAERARHLISASMPDVLDVDLEQTVGLIEAHAYAVLDVRSLEGGALRLIHCRNPWGRGEWNGAWSDKSDKWTPDMRRLLNHMDDDDGAFWMAFDDFAHYFADVSVLNYQDGWTAHSASTEMGGAGDGKSSIAVFDVTVLEDTASVVTIHQPSQRGRPDAGTYEYGGGRFEIIRRKPAADAGYVMSSRAVVARDVAADVGLTAGEYTVVTYVSLPAPRECALSVYSQSGATVRKSRLSASKAVAGVTQALLAPTLERGEAVDFGSSAVDGIEAWSWKHEGGFCIAYRNTTDGRLLHETVTFDMTNAELCPPDDGGDPNTAIVDLQPGDTRLVRAQISDVGASWGFSYSRSFALSRVFSDAALAALRAATAADTNVRLYTEAGAADITCHTHQFEAGVCLLYQNKSADKRLEEGVEFSFENMEVLGAEGDTRVDVSLGPGEEKFVCIKAVNPGGFSFGTTTSFSVRPA